MLRTQILAKPWSVVANNLLAASSQQLDVCDTLYSFGPGKGAPPFSNLKMNLTQFMI